MKTLKDLNERQLVRMDRAGNTDQKLDVWNNVWTFILHLGNRRGHDYSALAIARGEQHMLTQRDKIGLIFQSSWWQILKVAQICSDYWRC